MNTENVQNISELLRTVKENIPFSEYLEECYVGGCHGYRTTAITLKPFDPINHTAREVKLCDDHIEWARERNAFAEEMYEEIAKCQDQTGQSAEDCRKQVGMAHIDRVQELAVPQGRMREDVLDGSIKETRDMITLGEALEDKE